MPNRADIRTAVALLAAGVVLVFVIARHNDRLRHPGNDSDSVKYVQAAQHLLTGEGLVHSRADALAPWGQQWEPIREWPPGFPLLIAGVAKITGTSALWSGVWISRVAWACLAALLYLCLVPLRLGSWGPLVALASAFCLGFLWCGLVPRSDTAFTVLTCLVLLAFRRFLDTDSTGWLVLAGLLAGASYTVRTVGVALILAVPAALVLATASTTAGTSSFRRCVKDVGVWAIAAAVPIGLLVARNLSVFGRIQPYWMAPSTVGPIANVRWLLYGLVLDVVGSRSAALWVAWNRVPFLLTAALTGVALFVLCRMRRADRQVVPFGDRAYVLTLVLYAVGSAAILVIARSRYQWGAYIDERYVAPFAWIILAGLVSWTSSWRRTGPWPAALKAGLAAMCLCGLAGSAHAVMSMQQENALTLASDDSLKQGIHDWARQGDVVVSDLAPFLSLVGDASVRQLPYEPSDSCGAGYEAPLSKLVENRELAGLNLHAVILSRNLCLEATSDERAISRLTTSSAWVLARSTPEYVILESPASRRP